MSPEGLRVYPVDGGSPSTVPGTDVGEQLMGWDGNESVLVFRVDEVPTTVARVNIQTGKRELVRKVGPLDSTGVMNVREIVLSQDGRAHAYTFRRMLSHLFLVSEAK